MSEEKKDSGPAFKTLVRICGLAGLGSLILPYFGGISSTINIKLAAFWMFKQVVNKIQGADVDFAILELLPDTMDSMTATVFLAVFIAVPLVIGLLSLAMLLRGKYAGGPFTIVLLFLAGLWLLLKFAAGMSFFAFAGLGLWIGLGALLLPFFGMFFLDKSI